MSGGGGVKKEKRSNIGSVRNENAGMRTTRPGGRGGKSAAGG